MLREVLLVEDQGLVRAGMRTMLHLVEPQADHPAVDRRPVLIVLSDDRPSDDRTATGPG